MKTLIVMRHAQALEVEVADEMLADALTPAGHEQAKAAGQFLKEQGIVPDAVIANDTNRTKDTAADLLESGFPETKIPLIVDKRCGFENRMSGVGILDFVCRLARDSWNTVAIVTHDIIPSDTGRYLVPEMRGEGLFVITTTFKSHFEETNPVRREKGELYRTTPHSGGLIIQFAIESWKELFPYSTAHEKVISIEPFEGEKLRHAGLFFIPGDLMPQP
jgi:phosphohistidine phosphatase SixA